MFYSIPKTITRYCSDLDIEEKFEVDVTFTENFKDILSYFFQKKYNVEYGDTTWLLQPNAKEFVNDLESKWLHDEIDTYALYHDDDFLEFMSQRVDIDNTTLEEELDDFKSHIESTLRAISKHDLKELANDITGDVDIEVYSDSSCVYGSVNAREIYEEEYGDDEDEEEDED